MTAREMLSKVLALDIHGDDWHFTVCDALEQLVNVVEYQQLRIDALTEQVDKMPSDWREER